MRKKSELDRYIQLFFNSGTAVLYTCRSEGDFSTTFVSPNIESQLGYDADSFIKEPQFWLSNVHPDDRERVLSALAKLQKNKRYIHEYRFKAADGSYRWMHDEATFFAGDTGKSQEIIGIWSDVTERVEAELASQKQLSQLNIIMQSTLDAIITMGVDGNVTKINKAAEKLFGYGESECLGSSVERLIAESSRLECRNVLGGLLEATAGENVSLTKEVMGLARDGSELSLEVALSVACTDSERVVVAVMRDIGERKKIEKMKDEFTSLLSHELRTPLTAIFGAIGLLDKLEGASLNDRARRLLDMALNNARRVSVLMDEMLSLESASAGTLVVHNTSLGVRGLLVDVGYVNDGFTKSGNVRLQIDECDAKLHLNGDKEKVLSVLNSLVSNAIKFSPPGGLINLGAYEQGNKVRVYVRDQGPGISDDFANKVFDRFAKHAYQKTDVNAGSGVGLSISKALIEAMKGEIHFQNEPGGGATFYFELPQVKENVSDAALA